MQEIMITRSKPNMFFLPSVIVREEKTRTEPVDLPRAGQWCRSNEEVKNKNSNIKFEY